MSWIIRREELMKCSENNLFEHRLYLKYITKISCSLEIEGKVPEHLEAASKILALLSQWRLISIHSIKKTSYKSRPIFCKSGNQSLYELILGNHYRYSNTETAFNIDYLQKGVKQIWATQRTHDTLPLVE